MREPRFIQLQMQTVTDRAAEAAAGLLEPQARVSPKFFYDALGSRLFDAITELDEYYLTRVEASVLQAQGREIADAVLALLGGGLTLVDLGAGNCAKAAQMFDGLQPARYVALDISADFLRTALQSLQRQHPGTEMVGVGLDFSQHLALPAGLVVGPALVFYPGSSIGNFGPDEALRLLAQARALSAGGALLIGVDLLKNVDVLEAAYDDPLGVTAAFNLNLLRHLNRLLGSDFRLRQWRHLAFFNATASRIEMHLEARSALRVAWPGGERHFEQGGRIHTENSYKWQRADFEALLLAAGYTRLRTWTDAGEGFAVVLAAA
jgi:dimethylhistidine N-methyltransferase